MGLATAKLMGAGHSIILVGRTVSKLEGALVELRALGIEAEAFPCDASNRESVQTLAAHAAQLGSVKAVVHAAGMSPHMGDAEKIFTVNAMSTIYIDEEFSKVMNDGGSIINVASMAGHMLPPEKTPVEAYKLALTAPEDFLQTMLAMLSTLPAESAGGSAYTISKNFVIWYSVQAACQYGGKGIRVLSVSPGTFNTPMGEVEGEQAASMAKMGALGRVGEVDEIAALLAFVAGDMGSYLTATDILCDGGTIGMLRQNT